MRHEFSQIVGNDDVVDDDVDVKYKTILTKHIRSTSSELDIGLYTNSQMK